MDSLDNISCFYKEYKLYDDSWACTRDSVFIVNSNFIENMIESSTYFSKLGGYMNIEQKRNRRLGLVPSKIICISICNTVKKVFSFNYNQAVVL